MPSTQTRTKLKAFQFDGSTKGHDAEKENRPVAAEKAPAAKATPKTSKVVKDIDKAFETPRLPQSASFPQPSTPAARLPLADLVGNIDDTSRHTELAVLSPEEQLYWRGSQPVNTPVPRKNKKRAHSSSPVGPSQDEPRPYIGKTPQADPATDLWSRYTSNKGTPTVTKSVSFAHLINDSSPHSAAAAAAGSVSGLRRWASCGVEFPTSTRKRRRTHGVFHADQPDDGEDVFAAAPSSDSVMQGHTTSNLANIVQRMKDSITYSQEDLPSSSSPLPDAGHRPTDFPESPLKRHTPREAVQEEHSDHLQAEDHAIGAVDTPDDEDLPGDRDELEAAEQHRQSSVSSDDFGHVDFDADMADAANTGTLETEVSASGANAPLAAEPEPQPVPPLPVAPPVPAESEDEFGIEDDDDVFVADLEQVASLFDNRPLESQPQPDALPEAAPALSAAPVIDLVNDDSDEFGDEIDPDEFAAAEVAATQTPATTVCRTRTYP